MSAANRFPISANHERKCAVQDNRASVGFARKREIVIRDPSDLAVEVGRLRVGPETRISVRTIRKGSRESLDVIRRRVRRLRNRLRSAIWRQHADERTRAIIGAVNLLERQLEAVELLLSRLPQQAWHLSTAGIGLPALCGSRPYFPAAP